MGWSHWYSIKSYVRSSLWIVPFIALVLYVVIIRAVYHVETLFDWQRLWPIGPAGTKTMLESVFALTQAFFVFTFGSLLVAIQVASGQLTPRIIAATLLRDNAIRYTIGLFIFTLLFATGALVRQDTTVSYGVAAVAGMLGFTSIAAFLYLIDYAARLLRPVSVVWRVGELGRDVIESVYPEPAKDPGRLVVQASNLPQPQRVVAHEGRSAIVLAVALKRPVALADKRKAVVELCLASEISWRRAIRCSVSTKAQTRSTIAHSG